MAGDAQGEIQCENQRWPVLDDSNPRVAITVNSPLVAFGQAKPPLEIEIVLDLFELSRATKRPARKLIINVAICWRIESPFRSNRSISSSNFAWRFLQLPLSGSSVAATLSMSLTYSRIGSCSARTCSNPRSMQPASRSSCFSANPPFSRPSSVGSTRGPPPKPLPFADRVDGVGLPDRH